MPVRTIAILGRRPGMSFEQFDTYWKDVHAPLAGAIEGVTKYIQHHIIPTEGEPDNEFGIDGFAELHYESFEGLEAAWATAEGQAALADVPNFLGKHSVVVLEEYVVKDAG
jgi:uncharacterized protein (TIGR02118 family)